MLVSLGRRGLLTDREQVGDLRWPATCQIERVVVCIDFLALAGPPTAGVGVCRELHYGKRRLQKFISCIACDCTWVVGLRIRIRWGVIDGELDRWTKSRC